MQCIASPTSKLLCRFEALLPGFFLGDKINHVGRIECRIGIDRIVIVGVHDTHKCRVGRPFTAFRACDTYHL